MNEKKKKPTKTETEKKNSVNSLKELFLGGKKVKKSEANEEALKMIQCASMMFEFLGRKARQNEWKAGDKVDIMFTLFHFEVVSIAEEKNLSFEELLPATIYQLLGYIEDVFGGEFYCGENGDLRYKEVSSPVQHSDPS